MSMNVFIDTNVYLNFYHYTSDELEELRKLLVAIECQEINLITTSQVIDEFKRNREGKIYDALKRFKDQHLPNKFPQMCKSYPEYEKLRITLQALEQNNKELLEKLEKDIKDNKLGADNIIYALFNKSTKYDLTDDILIKAKRRYDLGNPPGKDGSYGDAVNWELLLENVANREDLYIIADDKDYKSKLREDKLNQYLNEEWCMTKISNVYFYTKLSQFFMDKYPKIELAIELEKELAIAEFVHSGSFSSTHVAIEKLNKYDDYSETQLKDIVMAAITNDQIYRIAEDEDVMLFIRNILTGREKLFHEQYDTLKFLYHASCLDHQ